MRTISILLCLLCSTPLFSQTAENVLLVLNESSPLSLDAGAYYAQKRGVPQSNILRIKTEKEESITREDFEQQIAAPIAAWLRQNFAQDRILYILLTKDIPLRIKGTSGKDGTVASVDSELTLLYRMMVGQNIPPAGPVKNPYFLGEASISSAKPFNHADFDIYLVARLDGYNLADIQGLIDRGVAPSKEGKIILDSKGSSEKGDIWLRQAAENLSSAVGKDRVVLEDSRKALTESSQVLGYYSWGSNDPAIRTRHFGFKFEPGALAGMYVSSDGRTFKESDWSIGESGFPQSLAADLIRDGITGIAAHVEEPFLESTIRPNILFPAYLAGFNLIESYYLAMPYLSWQTVVIGDPLCAPFRTRHLTSSDLEKGLDPETELPLDFGKRRVRELSVPAYKKSGILPETIKLMLRSEARLIRKDRDGARRDLEQALSKDDRIPALNLQLASMYEAAGEYDKAIERYRRLLQLTPDNPIILNNLAYALAVRQNKVEEALPLAEKAYAAAKRSVNIIDTLGWIYHLAGMNDKAAALLEEAIRAGSRNPDLHLHFAVVSAAMGNMPAAEAALKRALELKPALEQSEEVKQLRLKIPASPK